MSKLLSQNNLEQSTLYYNTVTEWVKFLETSHRLNYDFIIDQDKSTESLKTPYLFSSSEWKEREKKGKQVFLNS